jgi:serine/threonine protein phosphatase PrpC
MKDHYLFAVFDGHGGNFTSYYCGENLVKTLIQQPQWKSYVSLPPASLLGHSNSAPSTTTRADVQGIKLLKSALSSTFLALDTQIQNAQRHKRLNQLDELQSILSQDNLDSVPEEYQQLFQTGSDDNMAVQAFAKPNPPSAANVNLERSGSTGVVVLITPTHILCANAGDSRALLCRSGAALPLSFDHKPNNDWEAARIDNTGGFVKGGRVNGDLAVSRSFGDFSYKSHEFCNAALQAVTVDPDILVHPRDYDKDEYIVLACDGVWDRLTNRDCASLVRSCIDEGESDVGLVCEEIIDTALEMDSRDNMTAALIMFPGGKMTCPYSENMGVDVVVPDEVVGVLKRRFERERKWGPGSTVASRAQKRLDERRKKSKSLLDLQRLRVQQVQRQQHQQVKTPLVKVAPNKVSGTKHTVPTKGHHVVNKVSKKNARTTTNSTGLQVQ